MKTRIIHTKIHKDPYVHSLTDKEYRVFVFLLTNEAVNMLGVYELQDIEIKMWCKVGDKKLQEVKDKFSKDNKIHFKDGWIVIVNHNKYNSYGKGSLQEKSYKKELDLIPNYIKQYLNTSIDTDPILEINKNTKTKIINKNTNTDTSISGLEDLRKKVNEIKGMN